MVARVFYRPVRWRDKAGRRFLTFLPWWRRRRSVERRVEFGRWEGR